MKIGYSGKNKKSFARAIPGNQKWICVVINIVNILWKYCE